MTFRLIRTMSAVLLATVALLTSHPRPVAAHSVTFRTLQHNVRYTFTGAIRAIALGPDSPWVITGQELCRNQYEMLKSELQGAGYAVYGFVEAQRGHAPSACNGTDGAIVMVASKGSVQLIARGAFNAQAAGNAQYGWVCVQGAAFLYGWNACSGHTHCCDAYISTTQAIALRDLGHFLNDRPIMIGADLNRTPTQSGPNDFYGSFDEVDANGPAPGKPGGHRGTYTFKRYENGTWHVPTKKIDYFFSGKLRMTAGFGVAFVPYNQVATFSDHNYIHGYNQM